ncbi:hypothetical protein JCM8097_001797 [Rhodosporidiobolus ruineniae]
MAEQLPQGSAAPSSATAWLRKLREAVLRLDKHSSVPTRAEPNNDATNALVDLLFLDKRLRWSEVEPHLSHLYLSGGRHPEALRQRIFGGEYGAALACDVLEKVDFAPGEAQKGFLGFVRALLKAVEAVCNEQSDTKPVPEGTHPLSATGPSSASPSSAPSSAPRYPPTPPPAARTSHNERAVNLPLASASSAAPALKPLLPLAPASSAFAVSSAANPLEALYADEDPLDGLPRFSAEQKGKGRAVSTRSDQLQSGSDSDAIEVDEETYAAGVAAGLFDPDEWSDTGELYGLEEEQERLPSPTSSEIAEDLENWNPAVLAGYSAAELDRVVATLQAQLSQAVQAKSKVAESIAQQLIDAEAILRGNLSHPSGLGVAAELEEQGEGGQDEEGKAGAEHDQQQLHSFILDDKGEPADGSDQLPQLDGSAPSDHDQATTAARNGKPRRSPPAPRPLSHTPQPPSTNAASTTLRQELLPDSAARSPPSEPVFPSWDEARRRLFHPDIRSTWYLPTFDCPPPHDLPLSHDMLPIWDVNLTRQLSIAGERRNEPEGNVQDAFTPSPLLPNLCWSGTRQAGPELPGQMVCIGEGGAGKFKGRPHEYLDWIASYDPAASFISRSFCGIMGIPHTWRYHGHVIEISNSRLELTSADFNTMTPEQLRRWELYFDSEGHRLEFHFPKNSTGATIVKRLRQNPKQSIVFAFFRVVYWDRQRIDKLLAEHVKWADEKRKAVEAWIQEKTEAMEKREKAEREREAKRRRM